MHIVPRLPLFVVVAAGPLPFTSLALKPYAMGLIGSGRLGICKNFSQPGNLGWAISIQCEYEDWVSCALANQRGEGQGAGPPSLDFLRLRRRLPRSSTQ